MELIGSIQTKIRSKIVPLQAIADVVPYGSVVLEIGVGQGLVAQQLLEKASEITGVDYDERKSKIATEMFKNEPSVEIIQDDAFAFLGEESTPFKYDVVILSDTLSSFSPETQITLLDEITNHLRTNAKIGKRLVIKYIDTEPRWKTRTSKVLSSAIYRTLKLSKSEGQNFHYMSTFELTSHFETNGLSVEIINLNRFHLIPHMLMVVSFDE